MQSSVLCYIRLVYSKATHHMNHRRSPVSTRGNFAFCSFVLSRNALQWHLLCVVDSKAASDKALLYAATVMT
jgi:hypothetical protein